LSTTGYNLVVKRPIDLVALLLERLCGNAQLSLEGDLRYVDTRQIQSISLEPTNLLRRSTSQPIQDFIILPVEPSTKDILIGSILPQAGLRTRIYHLQIQKDRERMFAAYDRFEVDCVWIGAWADEAWLTALVNAGILRTYTPIVETEEL
jgi:hypothetical protein